MNNSSQMNNLFKELSQDAKIIRILNKIQLVRREIQNLQMLDLDKCAENAQFAIDTDKDDSGIFIELTKHWHEQIKTARINQNMILEKIEQVNKLSLIIKNETLMGYVILIPEDKNNWLFTV
jgi:hypothetical protein